VNALYGDEVVTFEIDNPDSARLDRKRNGTFAISARTRKVATAV